MPRGDGTGPMGMDPMSGRGAGYCRGFGISGSANASMGRGFGRGGGRGGWFCGLGNRWRNWFRGAGAPAAVNEKDGLKQQAELLQTELDSIRKRLNELSKPTAG
jgi:hypothetical protein